MMIYHINKLESYLAREHPFKRQTSGGRDGCQQGPHCPLIGPAPALGGSSSGKGPRGAPTTTWLWGHAGCGRPTVRPVSLPPCPTADYYSPSMLGLKTDQEVLGELVRLKLPAVAALMDGHGMLWTLVASRWFICLFVDVLPVEVRAPGWARGRRQGRALTRRSLRRRCCASGTAYSVRGPRSSSEWP